MLKKTFYVTFIFALIFSVISIAAFAADDDKYIIVETDGEGETRIEAIESGLVEALRQASGSFIDSKTELNNDELTEKIISYSRGSVAKYEVTMADDTRAAEGIYKVKLKVWVERDLLRDGVKVATNKTSKVSFSKSDLKPEKEQLKLDELENKNSLEETNKSNKSSGVEALSAMLERYKPEDFISFNVVGKVTKVPNKENEDLCQVLVEVKFNDKLYNEAFIPDLKQVLDNIASSKKDVTLTKQRDILRRIVGKKGAPLADNSVILSGANLGKDFQIAVYDKPDRFGCRLYGFNKDDADKILNNLNGALANFKGRIARVKGFELELLDENDEIVSTEEQKITLQFLMSDSVIRNNVWAFHPTIMNYVGMYKFVPLYIENSTVTIPLRFELPEEYQDLTASINAKLIFEDDYSDAALKTRNALHNTAINLLSKGVKISQQEFEAASESEYPLAKVALESIAANEILNTPGLLLEEIVDRLNEYVKNGNYAAIQATFIALENDVENFESQKKSVPFLTQAAMVHPEAMIRMGEVQEQGFYGVKPNKKKADFYYKEGIRILSLLAAQGMPSAAAELGHVYIEGLGTKQDIPRAERYFKFAQKAGYEDPEYLCWIHFGFTLRQVTIPEDMLKYLVQYDKNEYQNAKTCMYLIREKAYTTYQSYGFSYNLCTADSKNTGCAKVRNFLSGFRFDTNGAYYDNYSIGDLSFNVPQKNGDRYERREIRFSRK